MPQKISKVRGLYSYPSEISEVPDGALIQADDVVIDRDSVVEPRPGFNTYATASAAKQLMQYQGKLIVHTGSTLKRDNGSGTLTSYSGTYDPPSHGDSYVPKIRSAEANSNFYFTSNSGVQKLDVISGTPTAAGSPQALDVSLALVASGSFMTTANQVAYRIVWGYTDANNNTILGAPSMRVVIANSSGSTQDVAVTFTIPAVITTSYFFQIYRSALSGSASVSPNDELGLIYQRSPTSGEISAKSITVTDSTPDSLRGASLYTNASQQGINQSNNQPPSAKDLALFKNSLFFANALSKQNLFLTLLAASGASGVSYVATTGDTTSGSKTVINLATTTGLAAGMNVSGTGIAATTTITSVDSSTQVTLSLNATATGVGVALKFFDGVTIAGTTYLANASEDVSTLKFQVYTSGTAAQNIDNTAQSLVRVINRNSTNTSVYAYYLSGATDLPGKIYLEARSLGAVSFAATATAHASAWNPQLPTSGTAVSSSNNQFQHYLYFSKVQTPEAVPLTNFVPVGSAASPIYRIIPLRESLIILKSEGVYRLTGDTPLNFTVDPLDTTVSLLAPETAVKLNNQIYAFTNHGIATVTDTGVGIISRPIEDKLLPLIQFTNFKTASFAVSYETARKYILCVPSVTADANATQQFVWHTFTNSWVRWTKSLYCGVVNTGDDKLYLGGATTIVQQRKNNDYTDYADEDYAVTITAVSGATITLSDVSNVLVGDTITQGALPYSEVLSIDTSNFTITVDVARAWSVASATMHRRIVSIIQWTPQFCDNPGILKHIRELTVMLKNNRFNTATLTFNTNLIKATQSVTVTGNKSFLWGYFAWGSIPWGNNNDPDKVRTYLPSNMQRASWVNTQFTHSAAYGQFAIDALSYVYNPMSERTSN